ncbi:HAD family hydrolase [Thioalkalivibrio sp. ALE31]|uniref:HAD family hydrolase n=1 Tax=Thioalkalivibrio sp. ALE31 TaxID=1158182 RepID=UPI000378691E|nr:HAD family hydrolase [Thioalkalivibrio sp. ALE31]
MKCPEVPGVRAFLEAHEHLPKYVVSAAPHEELQELARDRDLIRYFRGVLGAPPGKAELLGWILEQEGVTPSATTMFGDKLADLRAAEEVGVHFVGRRTSFSAGEFPSGVSVINSFTDPTGTQL